MPGFRPTVLLETPLIGTEQRIYRLSSKKVFLYQLESAFGGGSIDFTGTTVEDDPKDGVSTVDVAEFSITKKPKPGAFKGCL